MSNKRKNGSETPLWIRIICGALGVLMILGVIIMVTPTSGASLAYAAEAIPLTEQTLPSDAMINVGMHCESEAVASFTVRSEHPTVLSYRKSDTQSETLLTCPAGGLIAAVDANLFRYGSELTTDGKGIAALGGYHIQISFFTFSEIGIDDRDNPVYIKPVESNINTDGYTRATVADSIELLNSVSEVAAMGQPIFPYYNSNKTYIRLGSYYTVEDAQQALTALEKILTIKAEVVSPCENALTIFDSSTWMPVCELSTEKYQLTISPESGNYLTDLAGRIYRGSLLFGRTTKSNGGLMQVVNRLPLEEYVADLLSYEVSSTESPELLKSMAVILRTEAERHMNAHQTAGYDVCSDTHCHQFYGSTSDSDEIRNAVLETAGKVLTYENNLIYTPYTTQSGVTTISSADAFGKELPYLPAVITPWEDVAARWTVEITPYELYCLLVENGYEAIKGNVESVTIVKVAENSDYVSELSFTDHFGNAVTVSGSEKIRMLFGGLLPSTQFVVGKAGEKVEITHRTLTGDGLSYTETTEKLLLEGTYDSFVFSGRGIGCGVGLSIAGARALCEMGYTYDQILAIYYPATKIE